MSFWIMPSFRYGGSGLDHVNPFCYEVVIVSQQNGKINYDL